RFLVHLGFTLFWCGVFYKAWRMRMPAEYLIFAALLILLPTTGGLLVSIGRCGMVAFPLFWALAELGESERVDTLVKTTFPMLLAALSLTTSTPHTCTPEGLAYTTPTSISTARRNVAAMPKTAAYCVMVGADAEAASRCLLNIQRPPVRRHGPPMPGPPF